MEELLFTETGKGIVMTSLDIAELTGKRHKHVMADVRKEIKDLGEEIGRTIFRPTERVDSQNRKQPIFQFGKRGAMQLALRYDAVTRFRVVRRIEELENEQPKLPTTYKEALLALVAAEEEKEKLMADNAVKTQIIGELKPKANYTDIVLKAKNAITITQIAKDYGMSGQKMNQLLHELEVQYKQSGQWLLYAEHAGQGYTESDTFYDNRGYARVNTKWTQKGRLFIYNLLKNEKGILPMIEQDQREYAFGNNKNLSMM